MAVDPRWLEQTRMRNREQFGMAGLGGLGAGSATDLSDTLMRVREARVAQEQSDRERAAAILAQEQLAKDPRTAVLLALAKTPEAPVFQIPEARPIPRGVKIAAGLVAAGLVVFIAGQVWKRMSS